MNKMFILQESSFVIFIEKLAPILILGSIFLVIFDKFEIAFELKDTIFLFLIVIIAISRGIFVLLNNKCVITINDNSLTLLKGNNLSKSYKFEDIEKMSYMYYGVYNITFKNGEKEKVKMYNELIQIERKYIDINVILHNILQQRFSSHYTEDLVLYSENNNYPDYLTKYDRKIKGKRIIATILYAVFSIPIIVLFFINLFFIILSLILK